MKKGAGGYHFIQDWGTFDNDTLVCVGMTKDEILSVIATFHDSYRFVEWFRKNAPNDECTKGYFMEFEAKSVLSIKVYGDAWEFWETLIHELHHAVHIVLGHNRGMEEEKEALAYQQQFLFHEMRKKLQEHFHPKKMKSKQKTAP